MPKLKATSAALAALVALAWGASASAQSLSPVDSGPELGIGPDHIQVGVAATAAYETNVAHVGEAQAAQRRLTLEDEIFTPALTVDLQKALGSGAVFLDGSAGYNFYARNRVLNRENLSLRGGLRGRLRACSGTLSGDVDRGLNQLVDATLQQVQETYTQTTVEADVACGRAVGLAPTASVFESWGDNSDSTLAASNSRTFGGSAGLAYRTPASGVVSLSALYRKTEFPDAPPALSQGAKSGYEVTGGTIKYERQIGSRIQGSASATYTTVHSNASPDFHGLTYRLDLTYRVGPRLQLQGVFARSVIPSNLLTANYRLQNDNLLQAQYRFSSRLRAAAGVSQQVGREGGAAGLTPLDLLHYDVRSVFSSLTYSLNKVDLTLAIRNDQRDTNETGLNYSDTRASISVNTVF